MTRSLRFSTLSGVLLLVACGGGSNVTGVVPLPSPVATLVRLAITPDTAQAVAQDPYLMFTGGDTVRMAVRGVMSDGSTKPVAIDSVGTNGAGRVAFKSDTAKFVTSVPGAYSVTIYAQGVSGVARLTAQYPPIRIAVALPSRCTDSVGATFAFTIRTALDPSGDTVPVGAVTWSVADSTVATIDANGLLTTLKSGSTAVYAKASGATGVGFVWVAPFGGCAALAGS